MTDRTAELLSQRNQLAEILRAIPEVPRRAYRPPIIDVSAVFETESAPARGVEDDPSALVPGLKAFESSVEREIIALDKFLDLSKGRQSAKAQQPSTNAPYFISVWKEISQSNSLVSIGQTFESFANGSSMKIDVVRDAGRTWLRVNTIKNNRLKAEFNEIDAMSDEDDDPHTDDEQTEQDAHNPDWHQNSVLKMADTLLAVARSNPIAGTTIPPRIIMRLPRLKEDPKEERINLTIQELRLREIQVQVGERMSNEFDEAAPSLPISPQLQPSVNLNLDLSLLVAIVSDITHAPLAPNPEVARDRYKPLVRKWKKPSAPDDIASDSGLAAHSRALGLQAEQECQRSLFDGIKQRLDESPAAGRAFYASAEARNRLRGILAKIGGGDERRRAEALFEEDPEKAKENFWRGSRFPKEYIDNLIPIRVHQNASEPSADWTPSPFFAHLALTCERVLAEIEKDGLDPEDQSFMPVKVFQKASASKADRDGNRSPSLTPHTLGSLLLGARRGMTTMTANRTSVKAIMREMVRPRQQDPQLDVTSRSPLEEQAESIIAIWVSEPRSLAENMRNTGQDRVGGELIDSKNDSTSN